MFEKKYIWRWILFSSVLYVILSYFFWKTNGLLFIWSENSNGVIVKYVTDLYSSGSDDNNMIGISIMLYLILIGIYSFYRKDVLWGVGIHIVTIVLQSVSLLLIESGSIFDTIIYDKNFILLLWLMNFFFLIYLLFKSFYIFIPSEKNLKKEKEK